MTTLEIGFANGTLPGQPELGDERFLVHHDADDTVLATIRAFSRTAQWYTRLSEPLARCIDDQTTNRPRVSSPRDRRT